MRQALLFRLKIRKRDGARSYMSTNGCTHGMYRQLVAWIRFPQRPAIVNVLLKQGVRKARIAQGNRHGKVDAAARLDLLVEQIATVL